MQNNVLLSVCIIKRDVTPFDILIVIPLSKRKYCNHIHYLKRSHPFILAILIVYGNAIEHFADLAQLNSKS